jgi:hypothetical protein
MLDERRRPLAMDASLTVPLTVRATPRIALGVDLSRERAIVRFALHPHPAYLKCLAQHPEDPTRRPFVRVGVVRGSLDDEIFLVGKYIKPNLRLGLYTMERSPLRVDGTVDPAFRHFGLAWYQSDVESNDVGVLSANRRGIVLDQFFGFDASMRAASTGTFHLGLWFHDAAAAVCSSDEDALCRGPVAMMSAPIAATGLGPLCTYPEAWSPETHGPPTSSSPADGAL